MRRVSWPLIGLALGAVIGAFWGWLGDGAAEPADSVLGAALMCALPGVLIGAVAAGAANRWDHDQY
jgi:hypothetical protein